MDFWDWRRPEGREGLRQHAFRSRVRGSKTLKLERWRDALRQRVAAQERDTTEYRNLEPVLAARAAARADLEMVENELRWRRQGPDGPFR